MKYVFAVVVHFFFFLGLPYLIAAIMGRGAPAATLYLAILATYIYAAFYRRGPAPPK